MYRYKCVVSECADRKVFYDTVSKLKELYPDCTENTSASFDRNSMGQVLLVPNNKGGNTKISVNYNLYDKCVYIMLEERLFDSFDGKITSIITADTVSRKLFICFSIGFSLINIIAMLIFWEYEMQLTPNVIISAVLAAVYTAFMVGVNSKSDFDILLPKLLFLTFGGFAVISLIIAAAVVFSLLIGGWGLVLLAFFGICYIRTVIPALIISAFVYKKILRL